MAEPTRVSGAAGHSHSARLVGRTRDLPWPHPVPPRRGRVRESGAVEDLTPRTAGISTDSRHLSRLFSCVLGGRQVQSQHYRMPGIEPWSVISKPTKWQRSCASRRHVGAPCSLRMGDGIERRAGDSPAFTISDGRGGSTICPTGLQRNRLVSPDFGTSQEVP